MSTSKNISNLQPIISSAGSWIPVGGNIQLANAFYSQITLPNGNLGIVINGWSYNGWNNSTHHDVSAAVLELDASGAMAIATSKWITDPINNGSGSVLVADFNNDSKQDIFLAAHNESPFEPKSSTAYITNNNNGYTKINLTDAIEAHGAGVYTFNNLPTVFIGNYGGDINPYYQYKSGNFIQTTATPLISPENGAKVAPVNGDSVAIADFNGDGEVDIVYADCGFGPGFEGFKANQQLIVVYKLNDAYNFTGSPEAVLTPYFNSRSEYASIQALNGPGQAHTYRVWIDDINHDGKDDILAGESLWSKTNIAQNFSILQLLQNTTTNGKMSFVDKTDSLNKDYNVNTTEVDYSMQMIDIDNSGINTYLMAGNINIYNSEVQSNYILLNDGTGKLYVYMHDQFQSIGEAVNNYLRSQGIYNSLQPRLIEYVTPNGNINLLAELQLNGRHEFVNVPLQLNPANDFITNINIIDRNGSTLMRTWAGNDTFTDVNANSSLARIDGGLGLDNSSYSLPSSNYQLLNNSDGSRSVLGNGISDTLFNIERLKFIDKSIAIDINGNAGTTAKILGAVFGKTAVTNKHYVGIGLDLLDKGMSYETLAGLALSVAKASTNDEVVTTLWTNVVGSAPSAADKAPFIKMLEDGMTPGALAHLAADTSINAVNINLVGLTQTGLEYTPVA